MTPKQIGDFVQNIVEVLLPFGIGLFFLIRFLKSPKDGDYSEGKNKRAQLRVKALIFFSISAIALLMIHRHDFFSPQSTSSLKGNDPNRYFDSEHGFSIRFPDGWTHEWDAKSKVKVLVNVSPLQADGKADMMINITSGDVSREDDPFQNMVEGLKGKGSEIVRQEDIFIDRRRAKKVEVASSSSENQISGYYYLIKGGKRAFLINCLTSSKSFENLRGKCDEIVNTFQFEE